MKNPLGVCLRVFSFCLATIVPIHLLSRIRSLRDWLHTYWVAGHLLSLGHRSKIASDFFWTNGKKISIGDKVLVLSHGCWCVIGEGEIVLGDRIWIGSYSRFMSMDSISIGNGCTVGDFVFIADNAHGASERTFLDQAVMERPLYSKGPVRIDDYVWIGDKVSIMPGVHIGRGSIIGANSVVTKDVPEYCVAVGAPARVVKKIALPLRRARGLREPGGQNVSS